MLSCHLSPPHDQTDLASSNLPLSLRHRLRGHDSNFKYFQNFVCINIIALLYIRIFQSWLFTVIIYLGRLAKGWDRYRTAENGGRREIWGRVHDAEAQGVPDPGNLRLPAAAEEKIGKWKDKGPTEERVFPTAWSWRSVHCICFLEGKSGFSGRGYLITYIQVVFVRTWNSLFCCKS